MSETKLRAPTEADWLNVMPQLLALLAQGKLSKDIAVELNRTAATNVFTIQAIVLKRKQVLERRRTIRRRKGDPTPGVHYQTQNSAWSNPPELTPDLRKLWEEGYSARDMATELNRRHGCSFGPNAVIGKVHRLGLEHRPSPIKDGIEWTEPMRERCRVLLIEHGHMLEAVASRLTNEFSVTITKWMVSNWLKRQKKRQTASRSGSTLPPLVSLRAIPKPPPSLPTRILSPRILPQRVAQVVASNIVPMPTHGQISPCRWPTNDGRPWLFCGDPSEPGKSYCRIHCDKAYIPLPSRRRDAA